MLTTPRWLLPDWAPNLHPVLVHFPVALLVTAVACDFLAFALKRHPFLRNGAAALYLLGTVLIVPTYLSGREAGATVFTPGMAHGLVDEHWTWAMWTLLYFIGLTGGRLVAHWRLAGWHPALWAFFLVGGAGGVLLLTTTAERGARLVFDYGVGVLGVR